MIDYVKFQTTQFNPETLSGLDWTGATQMDSGQLLEKKTKYKNLTIQIDYYSIPTLTIEGSIHKYLNNGDNSTDLQYHDVNNAINTMCKEFGIIDTVCKLKVFEAGINFNTLEDPDRIIIDYLSYKQKPFTPIGKKRNPIGHECELSHFKIKSYNKGKDRPQHNTDDNLQRFEVRCNSMWYLKERTDLQITTLADLKDNQNLCEIRDFVLERYDIIMKREKVSYDGLNAREIEILVSGSSPDFWKQLKPITNYSTYRSRLKRFEKLQEQQKRDSIHDYNKEVMTKKYESLLQTSSFVEHSNNTEFHHLLSYIPTTTNVQTLSYNYTYSSDQNKRIKNRQCAICEIDISDKKCNAKTCSKKCRNALSNKRNNPLRAIKRDLKQPSLFDFRGTIDLKQVEGIAI